TLTNSGGTFTYAQDVKVGPTGSKVCGTLTQINVALGWTGTGCTEIAGTCKALDPVAFRPVGTGYDFTCNATHTYDWDFGDNSSHSTLASPSHSYPGRGTYTVKLLVGNGTSSTTITRIVTVGEDPGGHGDLCGTMKPEENVYVTYFGDGCTAANGSCSAKANVAFAVGSSGYSFDCALHTYSWDFGDGKLSTDAAPLHRYTVDGTYHVKVHVAVGTASVDLTSTVKVIGGAAAPPPRGGHAVRH
ncbi:MAG: xanthomonalisin, partial [Thermoanaerobaculia bacterium]|nr:xanthomonalisin [Thermoanaerobaculia bacterium]